MTDLITQVLVYLISVLLFVISESLPFIKNIKSNGILHLIYNTIKNLNIDLNIVSNQEHHVESTGNEEYTRLLSQSNEELTLNYRNELESIYTSIDKLNNNLISTNTILLNSTNELINNSKQLKLHPSELYELNYIINYIKVNYPKKLYKTKCLSKSNKQLLISQGYIIDYDSNNDEYMIKW